MIRNLFEQVAMFIGQQKHQETMIHPSGLSVPKPMAQRRVQASYYHSAANPNHRARPAKKRKRKLKQYAQRRQRSAHVLKFS